MLRWKPRLRTILLLINLIIFLLPLGGVGVLRLYESELVRRTESELIAQGTLIGTAYREELLRLLPKTAAAGELTDYGTPFTAPPAGNQDPSGKYHPILPKLDVAAERILPPAPAALPADAPDPHALKAGELIKPLLLAAQDVTLVGIRVVDFAGRIVATTGDDQGLSLMRREEAIGALTGAYVSLLRQRLSDEPVPPLTSLSRGERYRVFVGVPVVHEGRVLGAILLSRTPLDIRKALYNIREPIAIAGTILFLVLLVITLLTSLTISRPLKALIAQAERIVKGENGAAIPLANPGTREVDHLSHAMARMAKTLEDRAEYIRIFATNVSHEFKTPLTTIRGTIELLHDHLAEMTPAERSRFLQIIADDTDRLDRLLRRLLDLAKADTMNPGNERIVLAEALPKSISRFTACGMAVTLDLGEGPVTTLGMAGEVFDSIISNLLENSRQHGGTTVKVTIAVREILLEKNALAEIDYRDNGPGISAGSREKVFRPFFTTARDRGGSGLGLTIVHSLIAAHDGEITLEPSDVGVHFRIRLPV